MSFSHSKKNIILSIFSDVFLIGFLLFAFACPWANRNYPMHRQLNVFFVLSSDTSGHDSSTGLSIFFGFILPSILIYLSCFVARFIILKKTEKKFPAKKAFFATLSLFVLSVSYTFVEKKGWKYFEIAYDAKKQPADSEFFRKNFQDYDSVNLSKKGKINNLIYIFMESMENSFADIKNGGVLNENLIPGLTELSATGINFGDSDGLGGMENLEGTSWTAAGLLSKTYSVPYYFPFSVDSNGKKVCLPGVKSLYDFIFEKGYKNYFAMGSEKQFENRDIVLETHNVEIHDIRYFKEHDFLPEDYQVFWGFEDKLLYEFAKKELSEIAIKNQPFSYSLLTVDTHFPSGYKCTLCRNEHKKQIKDVVLCADRQVYDFVKWIQSQDWYENTTIVIVGDHNYLDAPSNNFLKNESQLSNSQLEKSRKTFNLILNSKILLSKEQTRRKFSSFDLMPTILNAMGFDFDTDGIGLGKSLFGNEKTLIEKYGVEETNRQLMKRTVQYESLK